MTSVVVFDLDGVLWDSSAIHEAAFRQVLDEFGFHQIDFDYPSVAGRATHEVFRYLASLHLETFIYQQLEVMVTRKQEIARRHLRTSVSLNLSLISNIRHNSRFQTFALCTSSSKASLEIFFDHTALRNCFSVVLCANDVSRSKPEPDIYVKASNLLKVPASQMLVVEDSKSGIHSALKAGSTICHYHYDAHSCDVDHEAFPHHAIEDPNHSLWTSPGRK